MFPNQESQTVDNRARILSAAAAAFMEKGYRASIDDIAARAGVVKQTLYNHFECKEQLFREVIRNGTRSLLIPLEDDDVELREALISFSMSFRQKALSHGGSCMLRAVFAEAPRFPELASSFFNEGPEQVLSTLASFLDKAMQQGKLRNDDPIFAAEMLLGMLQNLDRLRALINPETAFPNNVDRTEKIVDCFLRAYAK